jgi:hypothetical protein
MWQYFTRVSVLTRESAISITSGFSGTGLYILKLFICSSSLLMNGQMDWVDGWMTSWIYEVEYPAFFIS